MVGLIRPCIRCGIREAESKDPTWLPICDTCNREIFAQSHEQMLAETSECWRKFEEQRRGVPVEPFHEGKKTVIWCADDYTPPVEESERRFSVPLGSSPLVVTVTRAWVMIISVEFQTIDDAVAYARGSDFKEFGDLIPVIWTGEIWASRYLEAELAPLLAAEG